MQEQQDMYLIQRVDELEKQVRRGRRMQLCLIVFMGLGLLMGAESPFVHLVAESLTIRTKVGQKTFSLDEKGIVNTKGDLNTQGDLRTAGNVECGGRLFASKRDILKELDKLAKTPRLIYGSTSLKMVAGNPVADGQVLLPKLKGKAKVFLCAHPTNPGGHMFAPDVTDIQAGGFTLRALRIPYVGTGVDNGQITIDYLVIQEPEGVPGDIQPIPKNE